jgi:hypothetical protein
MHKVPDCTNVMLNFLENDKVLWNNRPTRYRNVLLNRLISLVLPVLYRLLNVAARQHLLEASQKSVFAVCEVAQLKLGYGSRVGLHALPESEEFYRHNQMPEYDPDRIRRT